MKIVEYDRESWRASQPVEIFRNYLIKPSDSELLFFSDALKQIISESGHDIKTDSISWKDNSHEFLDKLYRQLSVIFWALNGDLTDKTVLDLGCGSTLGSVDIKEYGYTFEPWTCRVLHLMGVRTIGVDVGDLSKEKFETHFPVDLRDPDALIFLPDASVDLVHSSQLYTSPELERRSRGFVMTYGSMDAGESLAKNLLPQIGRVLKPDRLYVYYENTDYLKPYQHLWNDEPLRFKTIDGYGKHLSLDELVETYLAGGVTTGSKLQALSIAKGKQKLE